MSAQRRRNLRKGQCSILVTFVLDYRHIEGDPDKTGDVWTWTAVYADTKLLATFCVIAD